MTTISAPPVVDVATRRLLYCVLTSLLLHMGLSALRPGTEIGLNTPSAQVAQAPTAFQVTLLEQAPPASGQNAMNAITQTTPLALSADTGAKETDGVTSPLPALQPPQKQKLPPVVNGMFVGPWYYAAQYLHRRPVPLHPIRPDYPALSDNAVHTVRILMFISAAGTVDNYRVTGESDTPFAKTVINSFTTVDYAPGLIANIPVKSQLLAEVTFDPGSDSVQVNLSTPDGVNLQAPAASSP